MTASNREAAPRTIEIFCVSGRKGDEARWHYAGSWEIANELVALLMRRGYSDIEVTSKMRELDEASGE